MQWGVFLHSVVYGQNLGKVLPCWAHNLVLRQTLQEEMCHLKAEMALPHLMNTIKITSKDPIKY